MQRASLLFAGQLQLSAIKCQFCVSHADGGTTHLNLLGYLLELQMKIGDMESGGLVMDVTLLKRAANTVFVGMTEVKLHVCRHIEMSVVKPPSFGFIGSFVWPMVIGGPLHTIDRHLPLTILLHPTIFI